MAWVLLLCIYLCQNKGVGHLRIVSSIDKAYINDLMFHHFPDMMVHYLHEGISDHSPLVVSLSTQHNEGGRPFKFVNTLTEDPCFSEVVAEAWHSTSAQYKLKSVWLKLQAVKRAVKLLHKNQYSNTHLKTA